MWSRVLCLSVFLLTASADEVTKKFCDDESASQCTVQSASVDPCPKGSSFCSLKRNKRYTLAVDFTPRFSAQHLQLAMYGDDNNDGVYDKVIKVPSDPCDSVLTCPVEARAARFFNFHFTMDKSLSVGKFPVKFKLWNSEDENQACCFTFNVKVKK